MNSRDPFAEMRWAGPPGWRRTPPVTKATIVLSAFGYFLGVFAPASSGLLSADPAAIVGRLELWRLLTYPLVLLGIWNLLFGLLLFWALGNELEASWGSKKYGFFLLAATLLGSVLGTLCSLLRAMGQASGFGITGLLSATIAAWALSGIRLPVSFFGVLPMTRGAFALLSLALMVFGELETSRSIVRLVFLLGGLPVAWLWSRPRFDRRGGGISGRRPRGPFGVRRLRIVRQDERNRFH
jgi:membrane associated rhomboid family serine protease